MSLRTLSVKAFLFLGLCQVGRRGLASAPELTEQPKKIAVVGAGIGGTAAAYFLRQEFGPAVRIDVYEAGTVGGRLATENIGGYEYESGGSVIHPLNLHMKHFVDKLGLSQRADVPSRMAIFDGKELTFEESEWFIVNVLRMLWRYGLNFLRMHLWVESILDKFMRIYQYQQFGHCFTSVERLLHAMGGDSFLTLLNNTLEETMLANGFSQAFINDIVTPITRVNYGQSVRLPGFVGAVATFYEVNYVGESGPAHSLYDIVIVATPLHQDLSDISFSGISPPISSHFPGRYHQTVATLVLGQLNVSYLGTEQKPSDFTFSDILTTDSKALAINSLSSLDPAHMPPNYRQQPASQTKVWKVFSHGPLSELQLQELFLSREQVRERRWLAYPNYRTPQRRIPPFILHDRLFYLSAIDWAASAMEMSAIAARNTALLAHHRWYSQTDKVDQEDLHTRLRGEL
ncbi:prenylcysteine oxidase 1 isoform X2 [Electrophorus electricus]|uniref:prenylcysteine oxidase 1 isoform X2 n=1 Tax=Electrophorus electricus TaxID=8005 RepID=UPI0015CFA2F1|nr:prenylcysteine oxidase 1 isoform X2 [Electrophorus electricus]